MDLVYDTETSGLLREHLPADDPSQPRLLQLSARLLSGRRSEASFTAIVRPDGWEIEPDAMKHHGITTKRANRVGLPLPEVLLAFRSLVRQAQRVIAFNEVFDRAIINVALRSIKADPVWFDTKPEHVCVKELSAPLCKLPGQFGEFKWPRLEEAHAILVGEEWTSRHDAEDDRDACARVWWAIVDRLAPPARTD